MADKTRTLPPLIPLESGGWQATSFTSSQDFTLRGLALVPPNDILPVILVPGMMGTNLRAKRAPRLGQTENQRDREDNPGVEAWRAPNGNIDGLRAAFVWGRRSAAQRQRQLDAATLEVDASGPVVLPASGNGYALTEAEVRARGWGEVHADSYGALLVALQTRLNQTFGFAEQQQRRVLQQHWKDVIACDPQKWGVRSFAALTESELEKSAQHYFPVYAIGYNWLEDCEKSSQLLEQRIRAIIASWVKLKRRCERVILVTHSMGGLVARACARRIPEQIAGVIHGVMPALGAPVAYRRIAYGTETDSPSNSTGKNFETSRTALILGDTPAKTMPVLATAPGALALLPNHLYPQPWLHVRVIKSVGAPRAAGHGAKDDVVRRTEVTNDYLHLPNASKPNPYDVYRDLQSWYRLIDPALADPARKYQKSKGGIVDVIKEAVGSAEKFHRTLGDYYHPNTYAFFGDDVEQLSYGQLRWCARQESGSPGALTVGNISAASFLGYTYSGQRRVLVEGKTELHFSPDEQDARGDGTVPIASGSAVSGKVRQGFAIRGHDHQTAYTHEDILKLTLCLIVKLAQGKA